MTLAIMNITAVVSLRGLPSEAVYGPSSAFYYLFAAIVFLIPTALVAAELAAMFADKQGGVFRWVGEAMGARTGFLEALADLKTSGHLPIPRHLRDGHYSGSKELGNAQNYLYPHNYPGHWVNQEYLPEKIRDHHYFSPEDSGKYERALAQRKETIDKLRNL